MISGICTLFNARPIFYGDGKEIEIRSIYDSDGWMEVLFGKNSDKIQRNVNSDNLITRLYVEGEYGDFGYVGIDSENPTGLPFILNFDYYKELGLFTDEHQVIVNNYIAEYKAVTDRITSTTSDMLNMQGELSKLIGNYGYAFYPIGLDGINTDGCILGNSISITDATLKNGDKVAVVCWDGSYCYKEFPLSDADLGNANIVIKFYPAITGLLAAHEDAEKAASNNISSYLEKIDAILSKQEAAYDPVTISGLKDIYGEDLTQIKSEDYNKNSLTEPWTNASIIDYA